MNILIVMIGGCVVLAAGYFFYGRFMARWLGLRENVKTPAHEFQNNVDFVPTEKNYLLGQHLSAIAAAGPIVGPILAGMWFGWLPAFLWILIGGILIGGVHDMSSLVASLRHQGKSIAEVIRANMKRRAFVLFLLFLWFSLVYIITAFTDITASTFSDTVHGPGVASSSVMYLGLALVMGIILRIFNPPLTISTLIFMPLVFLCIYLGPILPIQIQPLPGMDLRTTWDLYLLFYCFIAAVIPVWLLLQPRGYLGGSFLTFTAGLSFVGIVIGSFAGKFVMAYPAFMGWVSPQGLPLFPFLFTTVACGACSGFHALVSTGTTAKQIEKETDAKLVGYGGMLLESFVAIIALATLLILTTGQAEKLKNPDLIYATGIASFLGALGVNQAFALNFALLAFATFVFDTLDVATRLGRYIFEELTGIRHKYGSVFSAVATLVLPVIFVTRNIVDGQGHPVAVWKAFWPVFGASNQLLAAMVLLGVSVWLYKSGKNIRYAFTPSVFMMGIAIVSLYFILKPAFSQWHETGSSYYWILGLTGSVLFLLAILLILEGAGILLKKASGTGGQRLEP